MTDGKSSAQPTPPPRWPRYALIGVILFVLVTTLWLLVFVDRVRRIRDSTAAMTNSAPSQSEPAR